jgi:hypothetical protein
MIYDINKNLLLNNAPNNIILNNGVLISGPVSDINLLSEAGYYTVRNDGPPQPENTTEDVDQRVINFDKPYVDISRVWVVEPVVIPDNISARQIRLWLIDNNISLSSVENAINGIVDEKLREKTLVEWEYAPYIERNHPLIEALAASLGLTSEQIDQGFIEASQL